MGLKNKKDYLCTAFRAREDIRRQRQRKTQQWSFKKSWKKTLEKFGTGVKKFLSLQNFRASKGARKERSSLKVLR